MITDRRSARYIHHRAIQRNVTIHNSRCCRARAAHSKIVCIEPTAVECRLTIYNERRSITWENGATCIEGESAIECH